MEKQNVEEEKRKGRREEKGEKIHGTKRDKGCRREKKDKERRRDKGEEVRMKTGERRQEK